MNTSIHISIPTTDLVMGLVDQTDSMCLMEDIMATVIPLVRVLKRQTRGYKEVKNPLNQFYIGEGAGEGETVGGQDFDQLDCTWQC